jgi:dipeptidyl aminopeptidase/acylaminoacyl peptidase
VPTVASYGGWRSPITASSLVEHAVGLGQVAVDGADVYWNEARPAEAGRLVVVRCAADGTVVDVVPDGYSARTRVHEYGGVSHLARDRVVWFTNFVDQRVYRVEDGVAPVPLTAEPDVRVGVRFADLSMARDGRHLLAVRETHGSEVVNDVAVIDVHSGEATQLVGGHDFFAAPRLSPDGSQLAWLSWDHPNMPWDGTELWVAPVVSDDVALGQARLVAGGPAESVSQPRWSPDGRLHYVSDRSGWWNLYVDDGDAGRALAPREAEFAGPDWTLGQSSFTFLDDGTLVGVWHAAGRDHLGYLRPDGTLGELDAPFTALGSLAGTRGAVVAVAGSPTDEPAVVRVAVPDGGVEVLARSREVALDAAYISVPEAVEFTTEGGLRAHAFHYRPANREFVGPEGERPPLVVVCHGGPTAAATSVLNRAVQFWTSRGFAVVDVDYGGSTGYGRAYRERLRGEWGVVDVDDCVNAARWLAAQEEVDGSRMVIRGGSAGGFTTLAALAFTDTFAAGASAFGVSDAEALARDTHKFESRYLDGLIGPWPDAAGRYAERSPIHHTDGFNCPLILFQGLDDPIVPPAQSEAIADALRAKGIPVAYLAFEGEQHGFRRAETIMRVAEAELWFYGRVFGFEPADTIEPVPIDNADALPHRDRSSSRGSSR